MKAVVREAREGEVPTLVPGPVPVLVFVARTRARCGAVVSLPVDPPVRLEPDRLYVTEAVDEADC